jgi:hypothetical protein
MAIGIANRSTNDKINNDLYQEIIDEKLNNESLTETVQNLISETIGATIVNSKTDITSFISANNKFSFIAKEGCKIKGSFNLTDFTQTNEITSTLINKVKNDAKSKINSNVNNNIVNNLKNISNEVDEKTNSSKIGTTFEGMATEVFDGINGAVDVAADTVKAVIGCMGIAETCTTRDTKDLEDILVENYGLDNQFKLNDIINTSDSQVSRISDDTISEIIFELTTGNIDETEGLCPKFVDISNVNQTITIDNIVKSETIVNISQNMAKKFINNLTRLFEGMQSHVKKDENTSSNSDIADLGDATAALISAGGEAVSEVIDKTGDAAVKVSDSTFKATTNVSDKTGDAIGSVMSGIMKPLIIFAIVILIGGLALVFILPKLNKKNGLGIEDGGVSTNNFLDRMFDIPEI